MKHVGMVLAAGASSRMGQPKALLTVCDNTPLARYQHDLLLQAGCAQVIVVLGCQAEVISRRLDGCKIAINPAWETGRLSSVKAGLKALQSFDGCVILPVDTVGVKVQTVQQILDAATREKSRAIRPVVAGRRGKIIWISKTTADEILAQDSGEGRLDYFFEDLASELEVQDKSILNNINTPEEWENARKDLNPLNSSAPRLFDTKR